MSRSFNCGEIVQYRNCYLLYKHAIVKEDLWVRDGKILNPQLVFYEERKLADVQVDCGGALIAPGFIDIQINGAFGVDFSDIHIDMTSQMSKVTTGLLAHGVTSFCPTIITSPKQHYSKLVSQIKKKKGGADGTGILGLHLEGPFINTQVKGAHPEQHILPECGGLSDLHKLYGGLDDVVIVTLAPELPGAMDTITELSEYGIIVSLGHSTANLATGEKAVQHGASLITHLFNAMLPFHHRDPHLVGLLTSDNIEPDRSLYYGIISDGVHTDASALRIAYRTNSKGLIIVTDAISAMGLSTGIHQLGIQKIEITPDHKAFVAGTNTLCGSIATMNYCVKFFYKATDCGKVDALESATLHPAQVLGITHEKGTLDYDTDADFIMLNEQLDVQATYIAGHCVWSRDGVNN